MKLAILGSNPLALEAAVRFHSHGAAITWFRHPEEKDFQVTTTRPTWKTVTSDLGFELLGKPSLHGEFSEEAWIAGYRNPLMEIIANEQELKPYKVLSISKRYLAPKEDINGRSRFHDLFRIIYQLNPATFIEKQKETDPAMFERLSTEMVESLQSTLEMYDDYDLILDLRTPGHVVSLNETGRAMGEQRVSKDKVTKGFEIQSHLPELMKNSDIREMILIGSNEVALEALLALGTWVRNPANRLFVATTESTPFSQVVQNATADMKNKFDEFMGHVQKDWENEMNTFHEKLREWQALDDFVQAKKPRPVEPIPQVNFFSGHNVTAIDQLIDRKRLFLTLEKPEFREGHWQPENNVLDLKTLGVDQVLVSTRMEREKILTLDENEKGYFSLVPTTANFENGWQRDLSLLKGIEDEIFKLFSPASSH